MSCTIYNQSPIYEQMLQQVGNVEDANLYTMIVESNGFKVWMNDNNFKQSTIDDLVDKAKLYNATTEGSLFKDLKSTVSSAPTQTGLFNNNPLKERHALDIVKSTIIEYEHVFISGRINVANNPHASLKKIIKTRIAAHLHANKNLRQDQIDFCNELSNNIGEGISSLYNLAVSDPVIRELSKVVGRSSVSTDTTMVNSLDEANNAEIEYSDDEDGFYKEWGDTDKSALTMSNKVKREINILPRLLTTDITYNEKGQPVYAKDSSSFSGIADTINSSDVSNLLLYKGDYSSVDNFLSSLTNIANNYSGSAKSLIVLANKLSNDNNLLNAFYSTFNKEVIDRTQQRFEFGKDGVTNTIVKSNVYTDPSFRLYTNLVNYAATAERNGVRASYVYDELLKSLGKDFDNNLKYHGEVAMNVDSVVDSIHSAFVNGLNIPLSKDGIKLFIVGDSDVVNQDNLSKFASIFRILDDMISIRSASKTAFNQEQYQLMKDAEMRGEEFTRSKYEFVATDRYNNNVAVLSNITTELGKNEISNVEANSTNVEGKVVSDVINPSYLSSFYDLWKQPAELESYLNDIITKTSWGKFSNGLIEISDKDRVIVPGIVKQITDENGDNKYVLTDYYDQFKYSILDGVRNNITDVRSRYSGLSKRDWNIQSINAFINNSGFDSNFKIGDKQLRKARYNITTPSDAPKSYYIESVVIPTSGLFDSYGNVNRTHRMYHAIANIAKQEMARMAKNASVVFEINENGLIATNDKGEPIVKKDKKDLYKFYHYNGPIFKTTDTGYELTGNVFKFTALDTNSRKLSNSDIFTANNLPVITYDNNGEPKFSLSADESSRLLSYIDDYIIEMVNDSYDEFKQLDKFLPTNVTFPKYVKSEWKSYDEYKAAKSKQTQVARDNELRNMATEYTLNYTVFYNEHMNMFNGRSDFYKNQGDTIKRNKQEIAGGAKNAAARIANLNNSNNQLGSININGREIVVNERFNFATISDPAKPSDNIEAIRKGLVKGGASAKAVEDILSRFQRNTDVADAQTYITLDEVAKRLYLQGKLEDYQDLINRLDDETTEFTDADAEKFSNMIQVQKNFYYDVELDTEFGDLIPNQIKNAEFVLIPRFIKNTGLELLYNAMKKNGIDQMNMESTEKATRRRMVSVYDKQGNITNESISEFDTNGKEYIREAKYARLYLQQDTPQHVKDTDNKAGVQIMKKIKDNVPSKYSKYVEHLDRLFTDNIKESYSELLKDVGYDASTGGLDHTKHLAAVKRDIIDRGGDKDMVAFAEVDADGSPLMPISFPMIKSKAEQIINAKFTNKVTRQLLPGFHSAQISNAGMNQLEVDSQLTESEYRAKYGNNMKRLNYMASDKEGYDGIVECLMPHWAKEFFDDKGSVTIEEVQAAGLDSMIGYRIPTEGKQSIVILKVTGFLSPAQGSTIVLPDEFVTQTGADFDIDSVYGIYSKAYRDKKGKLKRVKYLNKKEAYVKYVANNITGSSLKGATLYNDKKDILSSLKDLKQKSKDFVSKYNELSSAVKNVIAHNHREVEIANQSPEEKAAYNYNLYKALIEHDKVSNKDKQILTELAENELYRYDIADKYKALEKIKSDIDNYTIDDAYEEAIQIASDPSNDLKSPDEFGDASEMNTRDARNNEILDTMIELLKIPESFVESKSGSNFDIISAAKEKVEKIIAKNASGKKVSTNIFSPFGQSEYRSRATSGLELKGISVSWDGLTSILSVSKAELDGGFTHRYDKDKYDINHLRKLGSVIELDKYYEVTFNKLGWSNANNTNIDGFIITAYSSQTTANILDNVKDPVIDNLGELFGEFKIMPTLGMSFETASLYIRQPIVDAIADRIRNNKSIYDSSGFDAYIATELEYLRRLHTILNPDAKEVPRKRKELIESMKDFLSDVYDENGSRIAEPMSDNDLIEMLKPVEDGFDIKYQLQVLNNMMSLKQIADEVGKYQRVLNTDKVGASKGFVESKKMLDTIEQLRTTSTLRSGDKNLIDAIYPPFNYSNIYDSKFDVMNSVYPPLYAQLVFSTSAALTINTPIFDTYSPVFMLLKDKFKFTNSDTISKFEDYVTAYLLSNTNFVKQNVYDDLVVTDDYKSRIYGVNDYVAEFDLTNTSNENLLKFMKLAPANKIQLLQKYMNTSDTLLDYINYRQDYKTGEQIVSIITDINGYDKYKELFADMFNNYNPFVRIASLDLIRYAVVKEGFKYRQGAISNVIPFDILYNEYGIGGVGLISEYRQALLEMNNTANEDLDKLPVVKSFDRQFVDNRTKVFENKESWKKDDPKPISFNIDGVAKLSEEQANKIGILSGETINNRIKFITTNKLGSSDMNRYEVFIPNPESISDIYLLPINKLQPNEFSIRSVIESNNEFAPMNILKSKYGEESHKYAAKVDTNTYLQESIDKGYATVVRYDNGNDFEMVDWNNLSNVRTINLSNPKTVEDIDTIINDAKINNTKLIVHAKDLEWLVVNKLMPYNYNNIVVLSKLPNTDSKNRSKEIALSSKAITLVNKLNKHVKQSIYLINNPNDIDVTTRLNVHQLGAITNTISKLPTGKGNANGHIKTTIGSELYNSIRLQPNEFITINMQDGIAEVRLDDKTINAPKVVVNKTAGRDVLVTSQKFNPMANEDLKFSAIDDFYTGVNNSLEVVTAKVFNKATTTDDSVYRSAVKQLKKLGFNTDINNPMVIDINNRLAGMMVIRDTIKAEQEQLTNNVNMLLANASTGELIDILDDNLYDRLKTDNELTIRYLNLINKVRTFSEDYEAITKINVNFDESGLSDADKVTLSNIRKVIDEIADLNNDVRKVVNKSETAYRKYITNVVANYSTNPAVLANPNMLLEVISDESFVAAYMESIYETKNPLIQIMVKKLDSMLATTTIEADAKQVEYDNKIEEFNKKGVTVDDVVKDGYFITPMTQSFLDINTSLSQDVSNTRKAYGADSREYADALLRQKKFKADNVEQEYLSEVYESDIQAAEILNSNESARRRIKEINVAMQQIINNALNGDYSTLTDDQIIELSNLRNKKRQLGSKYDDYGKLKVGEDAEIANTIREYNKALEANKKKYYNEQILPEFVKLLSDKLNDIRSYPEYSNEYKDAERWIRLNTKLEFNEATASRLSEIYDILGDKQGKLSRSQLRSFANKFLDFNGVVDTSKMTDADIATAKKLQEEAYGKSNANRLIRANTTDFTTMTTQFYDKLDSIKNVSNVRKQQVVNAINQILSKYVDVSTGELDLGGMIAGDNAALAYWYNMLEHTDISFDGTRYKSIKAGGKRYSPSDLKFLSELKTNIDYDKYNADEANVRSRGKGAVDNWLRVATMRVQSDTATDALNQYYFEYRRDNKSVSPLEKAIKTKLSISDSHGNIVRNDLITKPEVMEATDYLVDRMFKIKDSNGNVMYNLSDLDNMTSITFSGSFGDRVLTFESGDKFAQIKQFFADNTVLNRPKKQLDDLNAISNEFTIKPIDDFNTAGKLEYLTLDKDGNLVPIGSLMEVVGKTEVIPNPNIYGSLGTSNDAYIDTKKTDAKKELNEIVETRTTVYYNRTKTDILQKLRDGDITRDVYNKWVDDNHIYNPYKNMYEPLQIHLERKATSSKYEDYVPNSEWKESQIKPEYKNDKFTERQLSIKESSQYYNEDYRAIQNNPDKLDLLNYLKETINQYILDPNDKYLANKGLIPVLKSGDVKNEVTNLDRLKSALGITDFTIDTDHVELANRKINLPMLYEATKESPISAEPRSANMSDDDYYKYLQEVNKQNAEIKANNEEFRKAVTSKDSQKAIRLFIKHGVEYNNKVLADAMLKTLHGYLKDARYTIEGGAGKPLLDRVLSKIKGSESLATGKKSNSHLVQKVESYYRRYVFNEFERRNKMLKLAKPLMTINSLQTMAFNFDGGVSNILLGEGNIAAEALAGQYFNKRDLANGNKAYFNYNVLNDIVTNYDKETASTIEGGLFKLFDVVETQIEDATDKENLGLGRYANKSMLFINQTAGEHMMQNATLLAVLNSHRVVDGKVMTRYEYVNKYLGDSLFEGDAEIYSKYKQFVANNKLSNANLGTEVDIVKEFLKNLDIATAKYYLKQFKSKRNELEQQFDSYETVASQFELVNGKAKIKSDSKITNKEVGEIRSKMMAVNRKIHGVYDKLGAARAQEYWQGQLLFQYKKHVTSALTKRFKSEYYNELRATVEKGYYRSAGDFLYSPAAKALKSIKATNPTASMLDTTLEIVKAYISFFGDLKTNYQMSNDTDQANLKRVMADLGMLVMAAAIGIGLPALIFDDEEEKKNSVLGAHLMYWGDRLHDETLAYSPVGLPTEFKNIYKSPIASAKTAEAPIELLGIALSELSMIGSNPIEYKKTMYKERGAYKGKHELEVWLRRNIPLYRQINKFETKVDNNNYIRTSYK